MMTGNNESLLPLLTIQTDYFYNNSIWHNANYIPLISLSINGVLSVLGNGFLIYLLLRKIQTRKPFEYLILNESICDFFTGAIDIFLQPYLVAKYRHSIVCKIVGIITYMLGFMVFAYPPLVMFNR